MTILQVVHLTFNFPKGNSLGKYQFFNCDVFNLKEAIPYALTNSTGGGFQKYTEVSVIIRRELEDINESTTAN